MNTNLVTLLSSLSVVLFHYTIPTLAVVVVSWYMPGNTVLILLGKVIKKYTLQPLSHFVLSWGLGTVIWAWQGYIFGYLNIRWLSYLYLASFTTIWFLLHSPQLKKSDLFTLTGKIKQYLPQQLTVLLVLIAGTVTQIVSIVPSGLPMSNGFSVFFNHAYDSMMHLAYIDELVRSIPPQEPNLAGAWLRQYHFWSNLVVAEIVRIWHLPVSALFFQILPIFLAIMTALTIIAVIKTWGGNIRTQILGLILYFWSGDLAYLVFLLLHQTFGFNHMAIIDAGTEMFYNMPAAWARWLFLVTLIPLYYWLKKPQLNQTGTKTFFSAEYGPTLAWGFLLAIIGSSLIGFKIYFGLFVAGGLLSVATYQTFKRQWTQLLTLTLPILICFFLLTAAIYLPANSGAGGLYWAPLEWPRLLLSAGNLDYNDWWLRRQVYQAAHNTRNLIILDIVALVMAVLSIHGLRILGAWPPANLRKRLGPTLLLFFLAPIVVFTILGFSTLQISGGFNVFNFFIVSLVPMELFLSFRLSTWIKNRQQIWNVPIYQIAAGLILLALLPRSLASLASEITALAKNQPRYTISDQELIGLDWIRLNTPPNSIILADPELKIDSVTPVVSYFSQRRTYLSGKGMLEAHHQPFADRQAWLDLILKHPQTLCLSNTPFEYIYTQNSSQLGQVLQNNSTCQNIYANEQVSIWSTR